MEMALTVTAKNKEFMSKGFPPGNRFPFKQDRYRIYELMNTIEYFLNAVWIEQQHDHFRLVVISQNRILTDRVYTSLLGAKIAFGRIYNSKAWKVGVKAQWLDHHKEFSQRDS